MKRRRNFFLSTLLLIIIFSLILFKNQGVDLIEQTTNEPPVQNTVKAANVLASLNEYEKVYHLEPSKWGIANDGTQPIDTTRGMNEAIQWAQDNDYTVFYIPAGTYMVAKGESENDPEARINLVSNMTFLMDENTVIQKETNGFEIYSTLFLDSEVENVTITGGTLRGDGDTHDYSQKGEFTTGTHEWGNGIDTAGARNIVIDGVKIEKFTGDGIEIGGSTIYGDYITEDDLELGGIDENGILIEQKGKVRSNNYDIANFTQPVYDNPHYRNIMLWIPNGVEGNYDIFFYTNDDQLIRADLDMHFNSTWGYSEIPDGADYFKAVFNSDTTEDIKVNRMTVAITKNITIKNCDIGYNRRQGITVGASDGVEIINNYIHHTNGIAPESGIDIEPGFYPAINTLIKGNQFVDNKIHMVFAYGGEAIVEENYFGPNLENGIGFSINQAYYGAIIRKNEFEHTNFVTWGNTEFINNKLVFSTAVFEGGSQVVVDEIDGINSNLEFEQTVADGMKVSNIKLTSSEHDDGGGISVYGEPIHMKNIFIQGNNEFSGEGNSESIYENVIILDTPDMNLALGKYNECTVKNGVFELNMPGDYFLNNCNIKNSMFYMYNTETKATFKSTIFENSHMDSHVILAIEAAEVNIINNNFNLQTGDDPDPIIQIGRDASANNPTKVFNSRIEGNTINVDREMIGIDTTNGGIDSQSYIIENNILYNANLNLKENDISTNNQVLSK